MISSIRIYDGDGVLKEEISPEKAKEIYNENNKENWCLSPTERQWWSGFKLEDPNPYIKKGLQPWKKRKYKKQRQVYETTCIICKKKTMKASKEAKYCGEYCYGVSRRQKSNEQYQKAKKLK
ncbi:MAG: hypothetical protein P8P29_08940 [Flavobacteriaceae bacterium]|nr:hypothetical protein [Flavobacteriaceae bacterium]